MKEEYQWPAFLQFFPVVWRHGDEVLVAEWCIGSPLVEELEGDVLCFGVRMAWVLGGAGIREGHDYGVWDVFGSSFCGVEVVEGVGVYGWIIANDILGGFWEELPPAVILTSF